jgi:hypothetical protein
MCLSLAGTGHGLPVSTLTASDHVAVAPSALGGTSPVCRRRRGARGPGQPACCLTQVCIAIPAATPALIERVDPNWAIDSTPSASARASGESPLPS